MIGLSVLSDCERSRSLFKESVCPYPSLTRWRASLISAQPSRVAAPGSVVPLWESTWRPWARRKTLCKGKAANKRFQGGRGQAECVSLLAFKKRGTENAVKNRREIRGEFGGGLKKWVGRAQHCPIKKQWQLQKARKRVGTDEACIRYRCRSVVVFWFSCSSFMLALLFEKVPVASSHCKLKAKCPRLVQGTCMSVFRPP